MVLLLAITTVVLSAIFSGLETGIYRLSRLRLRLSSEKGYLRYRLLGRVMRDGSGLLLSLLVANNLANYLATSSVTYLFLHSATSERWAELLATILTAPLLFVFAESLPKNIFLYRADLLTACFGPLLYVTHKALTWCGIVPLLKLLSRLFARMIGSTIPSRTMITSAQSHQVRAILRDTHDEGILSSVQTEMINRIVNIPGLRLTAVMVPMNQVHTVPLQCGRSTLLSRLKRHAYTRLPVWDGIASKIVGFVNVYEVLDLDGEFDSLKEFVKPIRAFDASMPVIDAIDAMRQEELKMVLVTRARRGGAKRRSVSSR